MSFLNPNSALQSPQVASSGNGRVKVALKPGYSLMDWVRFKQTLPKTEPRRITLEELAKHNKVDDSWTAIQGSVYNITPYLQYHPGGESELMKGAGIDATHIFNEIHKWVNFSGMLKECLIGYLVAQPFKRGAVLLSVSSDKDGFKVPNLSVSQPKKSGLSVYTSPDITDLTVSLHLKSHGETFNVPTISVTKILDDILFSFDMYQTNQCVTLIIYCKTPLSAKFKKVSYFGKVIGRQLNFLIYCKNKCFVLDINLFSDIEHFHIRQSAVKTEIVLQKSKSINWPSEGTHSKDSLKILDTFEIHQLMNSEVILSKVEDITHDTKFFTFNYVENHVGISAIGAHIFVQNESELVVIKPYTLVKPFRTDETNSYFQLLVKNYPQGIVTSYLHNLKINQRVKIQCFDHQFDMNRILEKPNVVMIAAGTGITPMIRIIDKIVFGTLFGDVICNLLFYNKTENDILFGDKLSEVVTVSNNRFIYENVLSHPDSLWTTKRGHVEKSHFDPFSADCLYLICGPKPFMELAAEILKKKEVPQTSLVIFKG